MKKWLLLLITILFLILLTGCGSQKDRRKSLEEELSTNQGQVQNDEELATEDGETAEDGTETITPSVENPEAIVGNWKEDSTGKTVYCNITFGSDGIFWIYEISTEREAVDPSTSTTKMATGVYSEENNKIIMTYQEITSFSQTPVETRIDDSLYEKTVEYIYSIVGNKLTLTNSQREQMVLYRANPE